MSLYPRWSFDRATAINRIRQGVATPCISLHVRPAGCNPSFPVEFPDSYNKTTGGECITAFGDGGPMGVKLEFEAGMTKEELVRDLQQLLGTIAGPYGEQIVDMERNLGGRAVMTRTPNGKVIFGEDEAALFEELKAQGLVPTHLLAQKPQLEAGAAESPSERFEEEGEDDGSAFYASDGFAGEGFDYEGFDYEDYDDDLHDNDFPNPYSSFSGQPDQLADFDDEYDDE